MHFYFVHPQIHPVKYCSAVISLIKAKSFNKVKLTKELSEYYPGKRFIFTDMGRSAFKLIIEKMGLQDSEILMPAYICDIFQPILEHYKIRPIFLDIDLETFQIRAEDIQKKITPNTKAVLVCHTYGLSADMQAIRQAVAGRAVIIEDCANSFFAKSGETYTGNFGDVSFFSLYKQFPALRGGMVVCPESWQAELPKTRFNFRDFISFLNYFPLFAAFFKKFGSEVAVRIPRKEKMERPAGINSASLGLFLSFFKETKKTLEHRKKLALSLQEKLKELGFEVQESKGNVFCYLSAIVPENLTDKRDKIVERLRKHGVFCTRIWHTPIILNKEIQEEYEFNFKDFPNTIEAAKRVINFPLQNHYNEKDIDRIADALKKVMLTL